MRRFKVLIFSLVLLGLVACSDQPKPEDTFTAYIDAWENEEYAEMYALLSESSLRLLSEEDFVERYTNIYEGIDMADLSITYELPEEEQAYDTEERPSFEYDANMDSLGGEIDFSHKAELVYEESEEDGDRWAINWKSSMIFPSMKEGDTVRASVLSPKRGEIMDVNGKGLAVNGVIERVGLVPERMEQESEEELIEGLSEQLNISVEYINQQLDQSWVNPNSFVPLASIADDDEEKIAALKELPPGFIFKETGARVYPQGKAAAHLTGYLGGITAEQLEELEGEGYTSTSQIGKSGLEYVMEDRLKGTPGGRVAIRDKDGNQKEVVAETPAVDGEDVTLTISADVQKELYEEMQGDSGSASAINPSTGEVKALVSTPAYDPNEFILGMSGERYTELQETDGRPLRNKFTSTYSPGSTFKPITAAIGLESDTINPAEEMKISGKTYTQEGWGNYSVTRVDGAAVDQQVDLRDALVRSDNIYFARSILEIGEEQFLKGTEEFGFGEEFPLAYPVERSQILNEETFGNNEVLLADTGYGQGQVQMSSLHLAITYTPFVTNGTVLKPVFLANEETRQAWRENIMSEETAAIIRERLKAVIEDVEGTGHDPVIEGVELAGKTGTAELKESLEDENAQENGWFIAWDTETSDLLISMMIEDVEGGSHYVVPKVKNVFEKVQ